MSDSTIEPLPDGDGKLGNAEGPADSGAGQNGMPGEHDGGAKAHPYSLGRFSTWES